MSIEKIQAAIQPVRKALLEHPLYQDMRDPEGLRLFMEYHVFAVWDFMSLVKVLQQHLCCVSVPWVPNLRPAATRLINEIVLAEESDEDGHGGYGSHYDMYHRAMTQLGASTAVIDRLLASLRSGESISAALEGAEVPPAVRRFVEHTFNVIATADLCQIAAAFAFGREDLLPDVFQKIVDEIHARTGQGLDDFQYYLQRHIALDGEQHGPMAAQLISSLCGDDPQKWQRAQDAAIAALQVRLAFWDAIHAELLRGSGTAEQALEPMKN